MSYRHARLQKSKMALNIKPNSRLQNSSSQTNGEHHVTGSDSLFSAHDTSVRGQRRSIFKAPPQQTSEAQIKTIHIPKSLMAAPFLQHPSLTHGQKRYLYSIANVYSTEHMRKLMKRHYLNVLHQCIRAGPNGLGENRTLQLKKKYAFQSGSKTDSRSVDSSEPNQTRHAASVHSGKITLPSIGNSEKSSKMTGRPSREARKDWRRVSE